MNPIHHRIRNAVDWKNAVRDQLRRKNMSRYEFVRQCSAAGICSIHTGECLMADEGKITAQRRPSFATAIAMAEICGLELTIAPKEEGHS